MYDTKIQVVSFDSNADAHPPCCSMSVLCANEGLAWSDAPFSKQDFAVRGRKSGAIDLLTNLFAQWTTSIASSSVRSQRHVFGWFGVNALSCVICDALICGAEYHSCCSLCGVHATHVFGFPFGLGGALCCCRQFPGRHILKPSTWSLLSSSKQPTKWPSIGATIRNSDSIPSAWKVVK